MLWAGSKGGLEVRTSADGATRLRGRFPYSVPTVLRDGREPKREVFEARAFGASIADGGDIHLLLHHDFDRPLASRGAGSLEVTDDRDALTFEATLSQDMASVGYVRDFLATLSAGLVGGVSPGFRVPKGGDTVKRDGRGLLRVVKTADLVEISCVTKPAYPDAQIEARNWGGAVSEGAVNRQAVFMRWRA